MKKFLVLMVTGIMVLGFSMTASATDYYEFSQYGGIGSEYDVACYGNTIYYGGGANVYSIDVSVPNMAYVNAPVGDVNYQTRTFSNPQSIILSGYSNLNVASRGELYVDSASIYTTGGTDDNQVAKFNKVTGAFESLAVTNTNFSAPGASMLSYDSVNTKWWMANENGQVWSSTGGDWSLEFSTIPTVGGSHLDGMEYINGKIWTSDMTSNFLQEYDLAGNLLNQYAYAGTSKLVEGMGFGALGHFWAGSGSVVYELGGGRVKPENPVPEPATMLLFGLGLLGLAGASRRKNN